MAETSPRRDYAMFDAELSGAVMNFQLLRRLLRWMKPYRLTFLASAVAIVVTSSLQVLLPIVISLVVVDHIIRGDDSRSGHDHRARPQRGP